MLDRESLGVFSEVARKLDSGFTTLPAFENQAPEMAGLEEVLEATAERLKDNYPYFHPLYAGQMLKPPHPVARLAYALAMWINPNNHALDGGRATSAMEREAVAEIAGMFGWKGFLGTFAAAEPWRISKPYGLRDNCSRERRFSPANRLTIHTGGLAGFCSCHSKRFRVIRGAAWTRTRWRSGWSAATLEPW